MTTAILSLYKVQKNIQTKIDSMETPSVNWKAICLVGFFAGLSLLIFYAWQVNGLARGAYLINTYEKQISKLTDENKNLQISFAENSFLGQALVKVQALNFQRTTSVKYINVVDTSAVVAETSKNMMR